MIETLKPRMLSSIELSTAEEVVEEITHMGFENEFESLKKVTFCASFRIELGAKRLLLFIYSEEKHPDILYAATFLSKQEKYQSRKGETTEVYSEAFKKMKETALKFNKDIKYCLSTKNKKMIKWAMDPKNQVFKWDYPAELTEQEDKELLNDEESKTIDREVEFYTTIRHETKVGL